MEANLTPPTASLTGSAPDATPLQPAQASEWQAAGQHSSVGQAIGPRIALMPMLSSVLYSRHAAWLRLVMWQIFNSSAAASVRYLWLDRLLPAYLFGLIAASKGWTLSNSLARVLRGEIDIRTVDARLAL